MDYKNLLHITLLLISSPARAWEEIRLQGDRRQVFTAFVYPMIGLCGLSVFIGALWTNGWGGPQCSVAVSLFGGYFLSAWLMDKLRVRLLRAQADLPRMWQFAGYGMVVFFLLKIVLGILPEFQIIALVAQFYTLYVVWEGSRVLLEADDSRRLSFTLLAFVLLVGCPMLVEWVFNELTFMLN